MKTSKMKMHVWIYVGYSNQQYPILNTHNHAQNAVLRLKIINRLRGKEPTPEPDPARIREAQAMASVMPTATQSPVH